MFRDTQTNVLEFFLVLRFGPTDPGTPLQLAHIPIADDGKRYLTFDVEHLPKFLRSQQKQMAQQKAKNDQTESQRESEMEQLRKRSERLSEDILTLQRNHEDEKDKLQDHHQQEIDRIAKDHQHALNQIVIIACTATGGLGIVLFCVILVFRCQWKAMLKKANDNHGNHDANPNAEVRVHVESAVVPGKLENHRPPILVDECDKFGMNEICAVTAGEGRDLVRIARPLETAGASRKLSEELLNIQPIFQDQEGGESAELHGTSATDTGGAVIHDGENGISCIVTKM